MVPCTPKVTHPPKRLVAGAPMRQAYLLAAALSIIPASVSLGQRTGESDVFLLRQRAIEEQNRANLDRALPGTQKFLFDWGGWFDWYLYLYDDGIDSSRTLRTYDLRLWAALSADDGIHEGYARMRLGIEDWNTGDSYSGRDNDFIGPNLERGWYQFDVSRALKKYGNTELPFSLKVKGGRDFVVAGTGYAISLPLDHVQVQTEYLKFETTFVYGRTPSSTPNIDRSRPVAGESNRRFWIIEERFKGFQNHEPFFYIAWNSDHTREDPLDLLQNYQYDSRYIGWGSVGELAPRLRYSTEWVIERGRSYGDRRFLHRDEIKAWAFDAELEYMFDHRTQPRVSLEYMFASGDKDRLESPTDARGGNRGDHVDNSFVGFGFRDTGLSLAPRLSNVHIWRAGAAFLPLPDVEAFKKLELGTDWFLFHKHRSAAAISDPTADRDSGYLGWEMDYYANYRMTSDLSWTVRFGTFFPGDSFSDRTTRTFLLTGVTWSF
jgi:hypothetical protein